MADPNTGMDKATMKRLLVVSKQEAVNCAVAPAKEPAFAMLMMDKIKSGKGIEAAMAKEFPESKNRSFGSVVVDTEEDAKLAKFTLNKAASGLARRLAKTLKGTGFTKVIIVDENGDALDSHVGEEEGEEGEGHEAAAAPAAAAPPPPPPPPPPMPQTQPAQAAAPASDAAVLEKALATLVPGIAKASGGKPDVQKQLVGLAQQAQAAIKGGDLAAAAAAVAAFRTALIAANATGSATGAPADAQATAGAVAFGKSRLAWLAARQKVMSDIDKLRAEIVATYKDDGIAPELESSYKSTVQPVIDGFDTSLADKLDAAVNATDPAARGALVKEAQALIAQYQKFLDGEPLIADLDDNPFVPLSIHATISNTLAALSKTVR